MTRAKFRMIFYYYYSWYIELNLFIIKAKNFHENTNCSIMKMLQPDGCKLSVLLTFHMSKPNWRIGKHPLIIWPSEYNLNLPGVRGFHLVLHMVGRKVI